MNDTARQCDNADTEHPGFPCNHPATRETWTIDTDATDRDAELVEAFGERVARDVMSGIITGRAMGTRTVHVTTDAGRFTATRVVEGRVVTTVWNITLNPAVDGQVPAPATASELTAVPITANTTDRQVAARPLTRLDLEFLSRIPVVEFSMSYGAPVDWMTDTRTPGEKAAAWTGAKLDTWSCVIAYEGEFGISMGVARSRYPAGYAGRTQDTFDVSPFPGGWEEIPLSRIVSVRGSTEI